MTTPPPMADPSRRLAEGSRRRRPPGEERREPPGAGRCRTRHRLKAAAALARAGSEGSAAVSAGPGPGGARCPPRRRLAAPEVRAVGAGAGAGGVAGGAAVRGRGPLSPAGAAVSPGCAAAPERCCCHMVPRVLPAGRACCQTGCKTRANGFWSRLVTYFHCTVMP